MEMNEKKTCPAKDTPMLQVMICTYGQEGLKRVAASSHPKVEGVEYLVCPMARMHPHPKPLTGMTSSY